MLAYDSCSSLGSCKRWRPAAPISRSSRASQASLARSRTRLRTRTTPRDPIGSVATASQLRRARPSLSWSRSVVRFNNARFKRPVVPGDQLQFDVEITQGKRNIYKYKGVARVAGEIAAEAELMCALKTLS